MTVTGDCLEVFSFAVMKSPFGFAKVDILTVPTTSFIYNCGHLRTVEPTKRQVRYYKSQLYNAFLISDVCNRSLCVIPFKTKMAKNQEHLRPLLLRNFTKENLCSALLYCSVTGVNFVLTTLKFSRYLQKFDSDLKKFSIVFFFSLFFVSRVELNL